MKKLLRNGFLKVVYSGWLSLAISSFGQAQPVITSFSPENGPVSTTVTVLGTGFNTTAANNVVFFGSTRAIVQSGSGSTVLTVTVPYGADYRYISVVNLGTNLVGYSSRPFRLTYVPGGDDSFRSKIELSNSSNATSRFVTFSDINNDGKPDILVANSDNTISIFPNSVTSSTGVAAFESAVTLGNSIGSVSSSLAIADFDGDGWLDIVAVFSGSASTMVYRNTTGILGATPDFAPGVSVAVAANPEAISVGDFDIDGLVDIVVTSDLPTNNITVLRNTSSGFSNITFSPTSPMSAGTNPGVVVVGDFDKDGKPDLVVANKGSNNLSVLRNATTMPAAITWESAITLSVGAVPSSIVVGDLDGDTWLDLAVANSDSDEVSVLLNTSTGNAISFSTKVDFSTGTGSSPSSIAIGDTDGDGLPDLITANLSNNTATILQNVSAVGIASFTIGNADLTSGSVNNPLGVSINDINGDSKPDVVLATQDTSNKVALFLQRSIQTLTVTSANTIVVDDTLSPIVVKTALEGEGGTLSYNLLNNTGSALVDENGVVTAISVREVTLLVNASGDSNYAPASVAQVITIGQSTPTLTITSSNTVVIDESLTATVNTTATYGRGGSIIFSMNAGSGSATVDPDSGLITAIGMGTVTLTVMSSGDADYYPSSTSQLITINKPTPILTITSSSTTVVDNVLVVTVDSSPNNGIGTLSYNIENGTGAALIAASGVMAPISVGQVTLTVTSSGTVDYDSSRVSQLIRIGQATPTLTILSSDMINLEDRITANVISTATFGRGGSIQFSIAGGSGSATVDPNSGLITPISLGSVTLTAISSGDADYYPSSTSQLITIGKTTPNLIITSGTSTVVDSSLTVTVASTARGDIGNIRYSIINGTGSALVNAITGRIIAVQRGTITLRATSSGSTNYYPVTTSQLITIEKGTPTLQITSGNILSMGSTLTATVVTSATYGRGGVKSFEIVGGSGSATVHPTTGRITPISSGEVTLIASTSGDANYNAASVSQIIRIGKTTPALLITSADTMYMGEELTITTVMSSVSEQGNITFEVEGGSGSATVESSTGRLVAVHVGSVTVRATWAGDSDYNSTSASQLLTIFKGTPTIDITSSNTLVVDESLTVTVSNTTGLGLGGVFAYRIVDGSGSAAVNGSTGYLTALGSGTVTLRVSTSGDSDYYPTSVDEVITINKRLPILTITSANTIYNSNGSLTATVISTARVGRGGVFVYMIVGGSGSATVNPVTGYIRAIASGTVTLLVNSSGDTDYYSASTSQTITIAGKNTQILTMLSFNSMVVDGTLVASVTTTAFDGGGTISYSVVNGTGSVLVNGSTGLIRGVQVGTVTLRVMASGNANYDPASITQTITISKATPTLRITSEGEVAVGRTLKVSTNTSATYGRGGPQSYFISSGSGSATVNSSGLIRGISSGTVTLTVSTSGDANYYSSSTSQLITIVGNTLLAINPSKVDIEAFNPPERVSDGSVILPVYGIEVGKVVSPNGDGFDDVLEIRHIAEYPHNELVIANRKGEVVFKAHGYNNDTVVFKGLSNTGRELEDGIYYYTLVFYDQNKMNRTVGYCKLRR